MASCQSVKSKKVKNRRILNAKSDVYQELHTSWWLAGHPFWSSISIALEINTSEKSHPKVHIHSSKVQFIILRHCLKAFSMTYLIITGVSNVWSLRTKVNNNYRTRSKQIRNVCVMWLNETLLLAATILPHEYFLTCLKACNYCSVLHAKIAFNYCTWNHCLTHYCMTYFTIYRQSRCPIYGTLCSNGLSR